MKRLALAAAAAALAIPASAGAVNDPFAPAEDCAPDNAQAIGHPANVNEQAGPASAPFSANNPGQSTGAQGQANSQAPENCAGA